MIMIISKYLQASAYLGTILSPPCDHEVLAFFAKKSEQTLVFGLPSTWTASTVFFEEQSQVKIHYLTILVSFENRFEMLEL